MSIEQHGQNVQKVPVENLPPYPHTKEDTVVPAPEHRDDKHDKKFNWKKPAAVVALLGAVGAGAFIAKGQGGDRPNAAPDRSPAASATPNPGASETAKPGKSETAAPAPSSEYGLAASEFANNPEKLASSYYEQLTAFEIAGIDEKAANDDHLFDVGMGPYVAEISKPIDQAFIDGLFAPGWEDNPRLASYVENQLNIAHQVREVRMRTFGSQDEEPFAQFITPTETTVRGHSPLITATAWAETNNADKNHAEELLTADSLQDQTGTDVFEWGEFDGQMKIVDVSDTQ
jgi:hypothetical protein